MGVIPNKADPSGSADISQTFFLISSHFFIFSLFPKAAILIHFGPACLCVFLVIMRVCILYVCLC